MKTWQIRMGKIMRNRRSFFLFGVQYVIASFKKVLFFLSNSDHQSFWPKNNPTGHPRPWGFLQLTSAVTNSYLLDLCAKSVLLKESITVLSQPVQPAPNYIGIGTTSSKREIYRETIVDDRCYECTESSLKALCKHFTTIPLREFCGKNYKWGSFTFFKHRTHF